jgi:hypothetical protein
LAQHLESHPFDSWGLAQEFIRHAAAGGVTGNHSVNTRQLCGEYGGSHCVGLAQAMVEELKARGVAAYVCAAAMAETGPLFGHAAVMASFQCDHRAEDRGCILMDPGLNLGVPVVVRPQVPALVLQAGQRMAMTFDERQQVVFAHVQRGNRWKLRHAFVAAPWLNADEALSAFEHLKTDFKLVARNRDGNVQSALVVDFKHRALVLQHSGQKTRAPLDDVALCGVLVSHVVAASFHTTRTRLLDRLAELVTGETLLRRERERFRER